MPTLMNWIQLGIVYLVWGTTFLAMKISVHGDAGTAPFQVVSSRLFVAAMILFLWAAFTKKSLRINLKEAWILTVSGTLIWLCANAFTTWAELLVESSYAVLIFGTMPIWTAVIGSAIDKKLPSKKEIVALAVGFSGIILLCLDAFKTLSTDIIIPTIVIFIGTISWSYSVNFKKRRPTRQSIVVSSAYQQFFSAIVIGIVSLLLQEPVPDPSPTAWIAWGYLVVFGSVIAFSAYTATVEVFPPRISMSFAFVCPVVGLFAGWLVLDEAITPAKLAGAALVLVGVKAVFGAAAQSSSSTKPQNTSS